ncbi:sulfite exporter TauE/SafE family protein [Cupriavidus sp. 2SB]|uniref:sulfite exporter TauE/SafE family protein n=1 Tax=Cupriavidus sp. 2SB TaxID=2502199 RepID=UPI0010F94DCE|nr:sulfite exporter TauE/SafE family protein [Cupriavidus sp. 2SB]
MTLDAALPILVTMAAASYFQTVTGFGLGMIAVGVVSGLHLAPVAVIAMVASLVTLANSAMALPGKLHHVDWRAVLFATIGILPSVVVGVLALEYLSQAASGILHFVLGAVVMYGGVTAAFRPASLPERSSNVSFLVSGVLGGVLSGMFGVSGPPLIFQFYRQPFSLIGIRCALIFIFTVTSSVRTAFNAWQGQISQETLAVAVTAVPVVALATLVARAWPPPLSLKASRRLAYSVLMVIGAGLMLPAVLAMFA